MDYFISMYIDDELSLDEKIQFVKTVHGNSTYAEEAISLLRQEKELVELVCRQLPETIQPPHYQPPSGRLFRWAVAASLLLVLSFLGGINMHRLQMSSELLTVEEPSAEQSSMDSYHSHRFIIRQKGITKVEITGSFTDWQKVSLLPTGSDDYWEVTLPVPDGEHRYSFIVDGSKRLPDPTVLVRETDDFGTVNSIINIQS